jgi:hypothetical protein
MRARFSSAALALAFVALPACGPKALAGSDCENIGDTACEGLALHQCDGSEWVQVAPCHRECSVTPPVEHAEATISADTTWSCEDGPHLVTGVVTIEAGKTLTVMAGAEVRFAPGARIDTTQQSRLVAEGDQNAPILFTADDETVGGWGGGNQGGLNLFLRDDDGEPSVLKHALVERAVNGVGLLGVDDSRELPVLENNSFRDNLNWGVLLRGCVGEPATPDLAADGNRFIGNGMGDISGCQ